MIDGDEGLTQETIEQFKTELVTLVEKYGLRLRTRDETRHRGTLEASVEESDERSLLSRIFSVPVLNRVISEKDLAELPAEPRAELDREILECVQRHREELRILDPTVPLPDGDDAIKEWFEKKENLASIVRAHSREILEIAARHGVPRAIAALKGEMSPEAKKAMKLAKTMLKNKRDGRGE